MKENHFYLFCVLQVLKKVFFADMNLLGNDFLYLLIYWKYAVIEINLCFKYLREIGILNSRIMPFILYLTIY